MIRHCRRMCNTAAVPCTGLGRDHEPAARSDAAGSTQPAPTTFWALCDMSAGSVRVAARPLCQACTAAVTAAYTGPTQAAYRLQRDRQLRRHAAREVAAKYRWAMSEVPSHGRTRELRAEVELLHGLIDRLLEEGCDCSGRGASETPRARSCEGDGRGRARPVSSLPAARVLQPQVQAEQGPINVPLLPGPQEGRPRATVWRRVPKRGPADGAQELRVGAQPGTQTARDRVQSGTAAPHANALVYRPHTKQPGRKAAGT